MSWRSYMQHEKTPRKTRKISRADWVNEARCSNTMGVRLKFVRRWKQMLRLYTTYAAPARGCHVLDHLITFSLSYRR